MLTSRVLYLPDGSKHTILRHWPWIAIGIAYLLVFYVLPPPAPLTEGFDQSYQALFTGLFLRGAQFGKVAIYTWGPWGFLIQPRGDPAIFGWALFGRAILAVGMIYGAGIICMRCIKSTLWRAIWLVSFLILADPVLTLPFLLF